MVGDEGAGVLWPEGLCARLVERPPTDRPGIESLSFAP